MALSRSWRRARSVAGSLRQIWLFDFVGQVESERQRERRMLFEAVMECKEQGEEEIAQALLRGLPVPVPVPHPYHLIIGPMAGSVKLRGPFTTEEKVEWDQFTAMKADLTQWLFPK